MRGGALGFGLGLVCAAVVLPGCSDAGATPTSLGRDSYDLIGATFSLGRLRGDVASEVRVVAAAAEVELLRRGYSIDRADVTDEKARLEARRPGGRSFERVVVSAKRADVDRTRVEVSREPGSDRAEEASIWRGIQGRTAPYVEEEDEV